MQRVRYEVDPHNRLVIDRTGTKSGLRKFRKVLDGRFEADENNNLAYRVKSPLSDGETIPNQVRISGDWSLADNHQLRLTVNKEARETFGDEITLQGQVFDVDKNSLIFSMTTRALSGRQSTYILNLQGSWKADENNRLSFYIKREGGRYNILTFNGAWEINKDHQIIYQYEKAALIRKRKETQALIFKGHWDIREKFRISYVLDEGLAGSVFDFISSAGILEKNYIKYEVGIALEDRPEPIKRTITLFGRWKLKKDTGILFEIEYGKNGLSAIVFGADVALTDKDMVSFKLKDGVGNKDLEMTLELSRNLLGGDGELFLRALASRRETAIYAGAAWRW